MKKPFLKSIGCFLSALALASCTPQKNVTSLEAMNTFMTIQWYGKNQSKIEQLIKDKVSEIEKRISTTRIESDIYRINNSESFPVEISAETAELIQYANNIAELTDGALNPALYPITKTWGFTTGDYRVPSDDEIKELLPLADYSKIIIDNQKITMNKGMMLDLGAVGKGYAGDIIIEELKKAGIQSALLDLGGNIQALGSKADGSEWTIGIKNPNGGNPAASLKIKDKAVITSGGYERFFTHENKKYIHIFDGNTGKPAENDIASMTIICDSGLYGDSMSTALFVMGTTKALEYRIIHNDFEMVIITKDNDLIYTKALEGKLTPLSDFRKIQIY